MLVVLLACCGWSGAHAAPASEWLDRRAFVCPQCYHVDNLFDAEAHGDDGRCPVCGMHLVERPTLLPADDARLHGGSGSFMVNLGDHAP